jgi:predicted MPP superfamily phosphohydrolase
MLVAENQSLASPPPHHYGADLIRARHSVAEAAEPTVSLDSALRMPPRELLHEQIQRAEAIRSAAEAARVHEKLSFRAKFLNFIEGPWAPHVSDLPEKRSPEESGNSSEPFRTNPRTPGESRNRAERIRAVYASQTRAAITPWTSLFEYQVPIGVQHHNLSGMTILHLSDVHLLSSNQRPTQELQSIARYIQSKDLCFDLVVFSGDLITVSPRDLSDEAAVALRQLTSRAHYSFFVPGNHDYHGHTPALISQWISEAGFIDLTNQTAELTRRGTSFAIHGVDDAYFGAPVAPQGLSEDVFHLVLTHNLDSIRANFPAPVDLILSGHTHWGEFRFLNAVRLMRAWGYCDDVNQHTRGWAALTDRSLSFVHPGLARYYVPYRGLRHPPGVVIHRLTADTKGAA